MGAPDQKLNYRGKFVVRALGVIFVTICCGMIVLGETLFREELRGPPLVFYWTWCFLITILAGIMAVVDLIFVRRASKQMRRMLWRREFTGKE